MIRIYTDSAADFSRQQADELNIHIIPIGINFREETFYQENDDFERFYEKLKSVDYLPTTSQANPMDYLKACEEAKMAGDEVIFITLSGKLSTSCQTAQMIKGEVGYDKVYIVDSIAAVGAQRLQVEYAVKLRSQGFDATQIVEKVLSIQPRVRTFGIVDTMEYLYRGGRMSRATAFIGSVLSIKPIIELKQGSLELVDKQRSTKSAIKAVYNMMEKDGQPDDEFPVYFLYSGGPTDREACQRFRQIAIENLNVNGSIYPVGGVVGTHLGPGCLGVTYLRADRTKIRS